MVRLVQIVICGRIKQIWFQCDECGCIFDSQFIVDPDDLEFYPPPCIGCVKRKERENGR